MPLPSRLIATLPSATAASVGATVQSVLDIVRERILSGVYGANTRLPAERVLAQELGVARNTLREALDILESQHLIHRRAGAGSFVIHDPDARPVSSAVASETGPLQLQVMRGILEPEMVRLAIMSMSPRQITGLAETLAQMHQTTSDPAAFARHEQTFRHQIAEGTGNPLIVGCYALVADARRQNLRRPGPQQVATALHHCQALFDAISVRDIETACEATRLSLLDDQRALTQGQD